MADLSTALWIKSVRRRAGFASQKALADELGVKRSAVGNWETARGVPSMAHAERFAVVVKRSRAEVLAKFGYPIGGGEPVAPSAVLAPEVLNAIQTAIAAGVKDGIAAALEELRRPGSLGEEPGSQGGSPRRRSA